MSFMVIIAATQVTANVEPSTQRQSYLLNEETCIFRVKTMKNDHRKASMITRHLFHFDPETLHLAGYSYLVCGR